MTKSTPLLPDVKYQRDQHYLFKYQGYYEVPDPAFHVRLERLTDEEARDILES